MRFSPGGGRSGRRSISHRPGIRNPRARRRRVPSTQSIAGNLTGTHSGPCAIHPYSCQKRVKETYLCTRRQHFGTDPGRCTPRGDLHRYRLTPFRERTCGCHLPARQPTTSADPAPGQQHQGGSPRDSAPAHADNAPFPAPATPRRGLPLPAAVTAANTGQRVNRCQPPCTWTRRPSPRADAALVRCPCPGVAQAASSGVRALIDRAWISVSIMSPSAA